MASILLLLMLPLLVLCGGIASCVEAFPSSHRCRLMHANTYLGHAIPVRTNIHLGHGIPVRTKSLQLSGNGVDFVNIASESSNMLFAALAAYPKLEEILRLFVSKLPKTQRKFPALKDYVTRPALENDIMQVYNTSFAMKTIGAYTVIVGSKGAGKSYATAHVLGKKPGVLYVKVTPETSSLGIKLLEASGQVLREKMILGVGVLYPLLEQVALTGHPITIVFEVERGAGPSSEELLYTVKSTAKELAHVANVIIVLSEANAGLAFGDDRRQKFIWVDGMTHEEATMYAKKVFPAVADHDLTAFFEKVVWPLQISPPFKLLHDFYTGHTIYILTSCPLCANCRSLQVGTMPLDVGDFATALKCGEKVDDFIETALLAAETDLAGFTHKPILKALKSSPDGVRTVKFDGVEYKGVNLAEPKDVAVAMKKRNAIVYHLPSGEYRLASRAHRTVLLERYNPVE